MANRNDWLSPLVSTYLSAADTIASAYGVVTIRLAPYIADLQRAIEQLGDAPTTRETLYSLPEYQRLLRATEDEMQRFSSQTARVAEALQNSASESGLAMAERLAGAGVAGVWQRANSSAVSALINFVDSPAMRTRFNAFGENAARTMADTVLSSFVQGRGALVTARAIRDFVDGVPLSWATNMTRTVQVYSYRYANHAAYQANAQILEGWRWSSAKDAKTCISCWAQDGKVFAVDQTLNDHHQGRCAPIPIVRGSSITWETGEDVFGRLPVNRQQEIMGPSLYEAWRRGDVQFNEFSRPYSDTVYGEMLRRSTNREMGIRA